MQTSERPVPAEMAALRVHGFGELPQLDRVPLPEPGPEDVLVEIAAAVISHHDLTVASGDFPVRPELPYVPGLEGAGHVVFAGADVDPQRIRIGMPVRIFGGGLGSKRSGTWAEYVAVTARAAMPAPETLDPALAAACGSVAATAWAAVIDAGGLEAGERIGITGAAGAVGSLALQLAVLHGAGSAVAWTRSPEKATNLPAGTELARPGDPVEPVDLLVDTVGGPLLAGRLEQVRPGGRAVLVGYTSGTEVTLSIPHLLAGDVSLLPLNMMRRRLPRGVEAGLVGDVASGKLRLDVDVASAGDADDAIARLKSGDASGRVVITW
jgi:2-desacetyl-2-hydroxyethyl bacteriochlorophyllide A dehydrogenase